MDITNDEQAGEGSPSTLDNAALELINVSFSGGRPPPLDQLEPFPEYPFQQKSERTVPVSIGSAVSVALDFTNQCMDCQYKVGSVVGQEIYDREQNAHRFIVWQDVSKQIVPKIHVKSSSFAEVRLFSSQAGERFIIDTKSLSKDRAQQMALNFQRRSAPAFSVLHSRWIFTQLLSEPGGVRIALEAGGQTSGIANMIPRPVLRFELKKVIEESLDFYEQLKRS
jgi:hypothetical protein